MLGKALRGWEVTGGGVALLSDPFSRLLLLARYRTREVVGQMQCRWWVIYESFQLYPCTDNFLKGILNICDVTELI